VVFLLSVLMETNIELFRFIFSDFFVWLGTVILIGLIFGNFLNFLFRCWNRFLRHLNIRKAGWPPPYLDADGDFKPNSTKGDDNG